MSNITFKAASYYGGPIREISEAVANYVDGAISGRDTGNDIERLWSKAEMTSEAFATLVEILTDKGILDLSDILKITWGRHIREEEADHALVRP